MLLVKTITNIMMVLYKGENIISRIKTKTPTTTKPLSKVCDLMAT
jgi:hypothetical protein